MKPVHSVAVLVLITLGLVEPALADSAEIKSAAPLAMKREWLGFTMTGDFTNPTTRRAIDAPVIRRRVSAFKSEVSDLTSEMAVAAALSGYGINVDGAASGAKRLSLYRVYKVARIDELDMRKAVIRVGSQGYVPTRIYYGWALYVLVESESSSFSAQASARIFSVDAKVKAQANLWGARTHVALRGLDTKIPDEIVVPRDVGDIESKFRVSAGAAPQPILVDYTAVGQPPTKEIPWQAFQEPGYQAFDNDYARFRLYRDPRVAPGILRVRLANLHPSDWAVWEIWRRGEGGYTFRWENPAATSYEVSVPVPTWPMSLVWVGHKTREWNPPLDAETGWTLDVERIK
jgi:hypothetical protein